MIMKFNGKSAECMSDILQVLGRDIRNMASKKKKVVVVASVMCILKQYDVIRNMDFRGGECGR